mmetsp:Transcript_55242/g.152975  ORF Transcript_55242/g.152975 Transcript_55242/m.152975 type:complete len:204 (-) Transcript_55242:131-742(-)
MRENRAPGQATRSTWTASPPSSETAATPRVVRCSSISPRLRPPKKSLATPAASADAGGSARQGNIQTRPWASMRQRRGLHQSRAHSALPSSSRSQSCESRMQRSARGCSASMTKCSGKSSRSWRSHCSLAVSWHWYSTPNASLQSHPRCLNRALAASNRSSHPASSSSYCSMAYGVAALLESLESSGVSTERRLARSVAGARR